MASQGPSMKLEDFALGKQLGMGKFGHVWKAKHLPTGKIVVLKMMHKEALIKEGVVNQIKREVEIHYRCRHPSIVRMFCYFQTDDKVFLVLEYVNGGTLYDFMQDCEGGVLTEEQAAQYMAQMVEVLHYLRTSKAVPIIHRDIKPENILVSKVKKGPHAGSTSLKLADFGWAVAMVPDAYRLTLCGTPEYMPPEVAAEDAYSGAFDVWTLGVLLYEMLAGTTPFEAGVPAAGEVDPSTRMGAIMDRIMAGTFTVPAHVSPEAEDLLRAMLASDQHARIKPGAIRRHPWMVAHVGEPQEGTFAPSKAGSRLVEEAVRRADAAVAPPTPPPQPVSKPVIKAVAKPVAKAGAKSGPRRVLVTAAHNVAADDGNAGSKTAPKGVAKRGGKVAARKGGVTKTTSSKRPVTRRRAAAATSGPSARRLR